MSEGQDVGSQEQHGPGLLPREGRPDCRGMRADDAELELLQLLRRDPHVRQAAEPRGHPVDGLARVDLGLHDDPSGPHALDRIGRQLYGRAPGHGDDVLERDPPPDRDRHGGKATGAPRAPQARRYS